MKTLPQQNTVKLMEQWWGIIESMLTFDLFYYYESIAATKYCKTYGTMMGSNWVYVDLWPIL